VGLSATAELLADRGAAAESDDFFRSPPFLEAEGVTHTLRVEAGPWLALVPLIVRQVDGSDGEDAISPYGYPGASIELEGEPPAAENVDWSATGLTSVFARERLAGAPWLAGARERSRVLLHEPTRERRVRPRLAEQVRANERAGWSTDRIAGPGSAGGDRDAFAAAYEQTMHRAGAAERYFFPRDYFDRVLAFERSWLVVARNAGGVGAAAIAAVSDGTLHYYLGGTADSARDASPFKNVVVALLDLADELALPLNLGGGVTPGDGLEEFKRGFANAEVAFRTHEVVCDRAEYDRLTAGREAGEFFPAYRAS
jgi:hypothetical protein